MPRLTDTIPSWVSHYVGLVFKPGGRDRAGIDCWGMVRLVYAERFGVPLPSLAGRYHDVADVAALAALVAEQLGPDGPGWHPVAPGQEQLGDVLCARLQGQECHVGVLVANTRMLHSWRGTDSAVVRYDTPGWQARTAGVWRFAGPLRVHGHLTPLGGRRIDARVPAGLSVAEALAAAGVATVPGLRVYVGDRLVPEERWGHVRPKAGRVLLVAAPPLGGGGESGGKTALRLVAAIALIAAAAVLLPALTPALGAIGAAIVVGAGTIAAGFAMSALAPPPKPRLSANTDRASPTISGARNEPRPFQPVPVVLGFHRVVPPWGAKPFTEIAGDAQFLRMLFAVRGPIEISDLRIGDTPITQFEGVEYDIRNGFPGEAPITLYQGSVSEDTLSVLVSHDGGPVVRTTGQAAEELSVDLTWPTGLVRVNSEGQLREVTVQTRIEYRLVGAPDWLSPNGQSPATWRQMDYLFRTPECEFGGAPSHAGRIAWGVGMPDARPSYLPATGGYSWVADGWFFAALAGTYVFGIDGSDAMDCHVDNRAAVTWYGQHAPAGGPAFAHTGALDLSAGWHRLRLRVEARTGNPGAAALGWQRPGDGGVAIIPAGTFFQDAAGTTPGMNTNWFDTSGYDATLITTEASAAAVRRNLAWAVAAPGQYEVRVTRDTVDVDEDRVQDDVFWTALRTITLADPIRLEGVAKVALRIRATDQLNGVIDQFNFMARSIVQDWDSASGAWVQRASNNPASVYRAVLQGIGNARPAADSKLSLADLQAAHARCAALGLTFNGVIDFKGTVYERLADVAAAARGSPGMRDGKHMIVQDQPQSVPVQHFTPRNSYGFRGRKAFADLPHALRCQFMDQTVGYQRNERVIYDDGYDQTNATKFESIELFGTTDPAEVWKHGRYHIAVARLRPEVYELGADVEHLACSRGDLVRVSHDVPLFGEGSGRVAALTLDLADSLLGLVFDEQVSMDAGRTYRVRVRLESGESFVRDLITAPGVSNSVTFTGPVAAGTPRPKVGDLAMWGQQLLESRELVVHAIDIGEDLAARLTLVDHAPAVHQADTGPIPPYDPGISPIPSYQDGPEDPVIESIRSDDWAMVRNPDGSLRPRMLITLRTPSSLRPMPTAAQVRIRALPPGGGEPQSPWVTLPLIPISNRQVPVEPVTVGVTYQIRLRVVTAIGQASHWVSAEHTVVGNILPPPDVQSFDVMRLSDGTRRYSWVLGPVPPDVVGVLIRYGAISANPQWEQMQPLTSGPMDPASPQELNEPVAGSWRFAIKMVDATGNESANAVYVDRTLGAARRPNSLFTDDARDAGWPGVKTGCFIASPGPMLEAIDPTRWDDLAPLGNIHTWDQFWRWNLQPTTPISYEHTAVDLGVVIPTTPAISVSAEGAVTIEFRWSTDNVVWSDWAVFDPAVPAATVEARYHQWRLTVAAAPPGQPVPIIREMVTDAIAQPIEQFLDNLDTSDLAPPYRTIAGDVRIPIDRTRFRIVRGVNLTFNGTGAGWSYVVVDKDVAVGPRVQLFNPDLQLADAVVDATVRGF